MHFIDLYCAILTSGWLSRYWVCSADHEPNSAKIQEASTVQHSMPTCTAYPLDANPRDNTVDTAEVKAKMSWARQTSRWCRWLRISKRLRWVSLGWYSPAGLTRKGNKWSMCRLEFWVQLNHVESKKSIGCFQLKGSSFKSSPDGSNFHIMQEGKNHCHHPSTKKETHHGVIASSSQ